MDGSPCAHLARQVLDFCRRGNSELRKDPGPPWIILWAGTISLLRTVGDALAKDTDPRIQRAYKIHFDACEAANIGAGRERTRDAKSTSWEPAIYYRFIWSDRNLLLHEAELSASQSVTVTPAGVSAVGLVSEQVPPPPAVVPVAGAIYTYPMRLGPFRGDDSRDVVDSAIAWWAQQIAEIELRASA